MTTPEEQDQNYAEQLLATIEAPESNVAAGVSITHNSYPSQLPQVPQHVGFAPQDVLHTQDLFSLPQEFLWLFLNGVLIREHLKSDQLALPGIQGNESHVGLGHLRCHQCSANFQRLFQLRRHQREHRQSNVYSCERCHQSFAYMAKFMNHGCMHVQPPLDNAPTDPLEELLDNSEHQVTLDESNDVDELSSESSDDDHEDAMDPDQLRGTVNDATIKHEDRMDGEITNDTSKEPGNLNHESLAAREEGDGLRAAPRALSGKKGKIASCILCERRFSKLSHLQKHLIRVHSPPKKKVKMEVERSNKSRITRSTRKRPLTSKRAPSKPATSVLTGRPRGRPRKSREPVELRDEPEDEEQPAAPEAEIQPKVEDAEDLDEDQLPKRRGRPKGLRLTRKRQKSVILSDDEDEETGPIVKQGNKPVCEYCHKTISRMDYFKIHQRRCKEKTKEVTDSPHQCKECGRMFASPQKLLYHYTVSHKEKVVKCKYCVRKYMDDEQLKEHEEKHVCHVCQETFKSTGDATEHTWKVHRVSKHCCHVCGKNFESGSHLRLHLLIHTQERMHECELCHKRFTQKGQLTAHMRTHSDERNFLCELCSCAFKDGAALNHHMRNVHSGIRPYVCKYCPKRFVQKCDVDVHETIHTGELKHLCHICHKRFRLKLSLKIHIQKHYGTKDFYCDVCGRAFAMERYMKQHKRNVHSGEVKKNHVCTFCNMAFRYPRQLKQHFMKNHTDLYPYMDLAPSGEGVGTNTVQQAGTTTIVQQVGQQIAQQVVQQPQQAHQIQVVESQHPAQQTSQQIHPQQSHTPQQHASTPQPTLHPVELVPQTSTQQPGNVVQLHLAMPALSQSLAGQAQQQQTQAIYVHTPPLIQNPASSLPPSIIQNPPHTLAQPTLAPPVVHNPPTSLNLPQVHPQTLHIPSHVHIPHPAWKVP